MINFRGYGKMPEVTVLHVHSNIFCIHIFYMKDLFVFDNCSESLDFISLTVWLRVESQ